MIENIYFKEIWTFENIKVVETVNICVRAVFMTSPPKGSHIVFMVSLKFFDLNGNFCYVGVLV